jgi:hypothetical protein
MSKDDQDQRSYPADVVGDLDTGTGRGASCPRTPSERHLRLGRQAEPARRTNPVVLGARRRPARPWLLALLVAAVLVTGCESFTTSGIHPVFRIEDPLPQDLSAYRNCRVRYEAASYDSSHEAIEPLHVAFAKRLEAASLFDRISRSTLTDDGYDICIEVTVSSTGAVGYWDRMRGDLTIAGIFVRVVVLDLTTFREIGRAVVGGQSSPREPRGTTKGAIEVAAEQLARFVIGDPLP